MFDVGNIGAIGAQYKVVNSNPVVAANVPTKFLSANPNRVAVLIADVNNSIDIGDATMVFGSKAFFRININVGPVVLTFRDLGPLLQGEFWGQYISGALPLYVTEIIYIGGG